ncbi:MAG: YgfZ/GcvT domain-containing protein [Burkholderiales bacterium]|jgi:folate-binding protein YgfZ
MGEVVQWNDVVKQGGVSAPDFGNARAQYAAARSGAIVTPLNGFELLRFQGADAKAFLQGQLTCDLDAVTIEQAQFGGHCNPKGRLLANFVLLASAADYLMLLPGDIAGDLANRLRKYVLRSRVSIEPERERGMLGIAGPQALSLLADRNAAPPPGRMAVCVVADTSVIRLPDDQFVVIGLAEDLSALWDALAKRAMPAAVQCWTRLQIEARVPWITQATREQFLPQMIGLDEIGGVSFDKGCFPGQEIVARTRYLGEVKRTLRLGHTQRDVWAGDPLFSLGQQTGTVLNAAPVPDTGSALLAVMSAQSDTEQTRTADGQSIVWSAAVKRD